MSDTDILQIQSHPESKQMNIEFTEEKKERRPIPVSLYNTCLLKIEDSLKFKEDPKNKRKLDKFINVVLPKVIKSMDYPTMVYPDPGAFTKVKLTIYDVSNLTAAGVLDNSSVQGSSIDKAKAYMKTLGVVGQETLLTGRVIDTHIYKPTVDHLLAYFTHNFNNGKAGLLPRDILFFAPMSLINDSGDVIDESDVSDTMVAGLYKKESKFRDFSDWLGWYNKQIVTTFSRTRYNELLKVTLAMVMIKVIWDNLTTTEVSELKILTHAELMVHSLNKAWDGM